MKQHKPIWQSTCTTCGSVAGEGQTIAELAKFGTCDACGGSTEPRKKRSPKAKRHHGGLTRRQYLDSETLTAFRRFMQERAREKNSAAAWQDFVIVEILSRTGMRAGELVCTQEHPDRYLRIEDVILDAKDPSIQIVEGKGNVSRVIKIPPGLRSLLEWFINEFRADAATDTPVVAGSHGAVPMRYHTLNTSKCKRWARDYEQAHGSLGLSRLTPHVFRHSYAVAFLEQNGFDYVALAEILGHADPQVTMRVYCHVGESKFREYANRM